MFNSFAAKMLALFTSAILCLGTVFGAYKPATTKPSENYYDSEIRNVIYLIGDGMGFEHLEKTKREKGVSLVMDTFPVKGSSRTRSFFNSVTDSAAGGTALSTGVRTKNSGVGVYPLDLEAKYSHPVSLTEICRDRGMLTGVVTTDKTSGATPSSFSAHTSDRYNTEEIVDDQYASGFNIIWGERDGYASKEGAEANGFTYITTYSEMMALEEGSRSFAQFENVLWKTEQADAKTPTLSQMAVKAVDILDDTDEGFFLMIEGAHIDKHSHNNLSDEMTEAVTEFDRTVKAMLDYAKADGETLVIVTADHETGGITAEGAFTSDGHTGADVPVLVYGSDKIISAGEKLNNYEIPMRIAYTIGFTEEEFPRSK